MYIWVGCLLLRRIRREGIGGYGRLNAMELKALVEKSVDGGVR